MPPRLVPIRLRVCKGNRLSEVAPSSPVERPSSAHAAAPKNEDGQLDVALVREPPPGGQFRSTPPDVHDPSNRKISCALPSPAISAAGPVIAATTVCISADRYWRASADMFGKF